ncbi:hypothetical protein GBAR_LOCUS21318 [Geodia barretti]|uniref:Uncharacterized protein n=1 Tax=Geodia barretti TaxID=519541 RepID=A0AA35X597_GEOBA|nr:hypothetical protein GBAR_LOCUS21318 [Geodia barretti]
MSKEEMEVRHHGSPYKPLALREHLRAQRFRLSHHDLRAFTSSWLPLPVFVAYRILLAVYLAGLTVAHIVDRRHTDGARWLIFITNWSFLLFLAATTLAAIMTLIFTMQPSKLVKSRRPRANTKISSDTKNSERAQTNNNGGDDINWL